MSLYSSFYNFHFSGMMEPHMIDFVKPAGSVENYFHQLYAFEINHVGFIISGVMLWNKDRSCCNVWQVLTLVTWQNAHLLKKLPSTKLDSTILENRHLTFRSDRLSKTIENLSWQVKYLLPYNKNLTYHTNIMDVTEYMHTFFRYFS